MRHEAPPTLDIVKVLEYLGAELPVHIKAHGWTPIRCPVHGGMSGSLNVSANKFHCFGGCQFDNNESGGDAYDLLKLVEGYSLVEAKELAETQGWIVDGPDVGRVLARKPTRTRHTARDRPDRRLPRKAG